MAHTYSQILLHIVFSTKERKPWLTPEVRQELVPFICGIVKADGGLVYEINGPEDHLHLFTRWRPDKTISDLLRAVKAKSSGWVHQKFPALADFSWEEGYSVFSVSKSQEDAVKTYIRGQLEHHQREDFKTELIRLLLKHGVEYDERYVFG